MDCKRPHKYRALRQLACIVSCFLLTASCSWVKDDTDNCPYGFWLNLHYTYNMLDVEATQEYISDVSVYVYDSDGNYVSRTDATREQLRANSHRVRIEGLPEGDYQFVVWSGSGNSQYTLAGERNGINTFRLSLAGIGATSSAQLPDLFHGYLPVVHYDDAYATYDVYMTKDTNQLSCLMVPTTTDAKMNPDDYTLRIVSANGVMNAFNKMASDEAFTYETFHADTVSVDDNDYGRLHGIRFDISTLRLMADTDCRLILEKTATADVIFNISLPQYIGMIGAMHTVSGRQLSLQEYLDRQDFYSVVCFLSEGIDQLLQIQVNSWRLRADNHLKL